MSMSREEKVMEILVDYANAQEAAAVSLKRQVAELVGVKRPGPAAVKEETFTILQFEAQQGAKIGSYEVAYRANNLPEKWDHAHGVLRAANATISSRYKGEDYTFTYWLYGTGKIYRQKKVGNLKK
jgi:hypothetical protein